MTNQVKHNIASIAIALLTNQFPEVKLALGMYATNGTTQLTPQEVNNNNPPLTACFVGFGPLILGPASSAPERWWFGYREETIGSEEYPLVQQFLSNPNWDDESRGQAAWRALFALEYPEAITENFTAGQPVYFANTGDLDILARLKGYLISE